MAKRVLTGGFLAGVTLFLWTFVAHEFLEIGEMGVREIPGNEAAVLGAMQASIPEAGFYIYPGIGLGPKPTSEQRSAAMPAYLNKYEQSPHGILIYHPPSGALNFGKLLAGQGGLNVVEGLLAAWLLSWAAAGRSYGARVGFVAAVGILASITTNLEYLNWYGFPGAYETGYITTQIAGYCLAGLVAAGFVKSKAGEGS